MVLNAAGARSVVGPDAPRIGGFSGHNGVSRGRPYSSCAYRGVQGFAHIEIRRWPSSKALRKWIQGKGHTAGWRPVRLGDAGILFSRSHDHAVVQVAVGRQRLTITVGAGSAASVAMQLATEAIPELR
jgi:hypothetical protein